MLKLDHLPTVFALRSLHIRSPHAAAALVAIAYAFLAFLATHTFPYRLISHSSPSLLTLQHVAPARTPSSTPTLPHSSIICFLIYSFHS